MANPAVAFQRAFDLHQRGQLVQALAAYDKLLRRLPTHADALHYSGLALYQSGQPNAAIERIERSLKTNAYAAEPWCNLALIYQAVGRQDAAIAALKESLRRDPRQPEIWNSLAGNLLAAGQLPEAEHAVGQALLLDPRHGPSLFNLALCCEAQGRLDEALVSAERALQVAPGAIPPAGLKAQIEEALGRLDAAGETLSTALALSANEPGAAALFFQRAGIEERQARFADAAQSYERVLQLDPTHGAALSELLFLRKQLADWHDLDSLRGRFRAGVAVEQPNLSPFCLLSDPSSRAEQRRCAEQWSASFPLCSRSPRTPANTGLRVGYLSADFREHATTVLAAGLFEQHDRDKFKLVGYSTGPNDRSPMRARLEAGFDRFVDALGWPPERLAAQIEADGIDLLVDLKGHTYAAPTSVLALRPAPVQVSYLGYPGTMGAAFVDYLIGDAVVTPFAHAGDYSEALVQLPACYQINDRKRPISPAPSRPTLGLPEDGFVFCCFNQSYKLNPQVFDAWARILAEVPGSVLWLLGGHDEATSRSLDCNIKQAAASRGIAPDRLVFAVRRPYAEYLGLYARADVFLDTWPYNGHTTASDALWAGCPVLTWLGDTFAGRVGASLLTAVGLPELIAVDVASYVEMAIAFAGDGEWRARSRSHLAGAGRDSPLFDTPATARALEAAYTQMAEQCRRGVREAFRVGTETA
jgi:protein O-GlcNAc transferase